MIRPSSLPALKHCPRFESDPTGSTDANEGTERHDFLKSSLANLGENNIDHDDGDAIFWAREYVKATAPMSDHPLVLEKKIALIDDELEVVIAGTPDVRCGNQLYDFKWRERDYEAQMAAYALIMIVNLGLESVDAHVLFGNSKRVVKFTFTKSSALAIVEPIIARARDAELPPRICDYCGWCARILICPAHLAIAQAVAKNYGDTDKIREWHPSKMETGEEISDALFVWRKALKKWGESIEFHALEAATKKGMTIPGFELAERNGKKQISDVREAFVLSGIGQSEFLDCCEVRLNKSKTYPNRASLDVEIAQLLGLKLAPAKKEMLNRLAPVIIVGKNSTSLKFVGEESETE